MEYLIAIGLIFLIIFLIMPKEEVKNSEGTTSAKLVIEKKKCPPHQWFWQEIVDQDGNKQGERIVCKVCGPLSAQLGRQDEG